MIWLAAVVVYTVAGVAVGRHLARATNPHHDTIDVAMYGVFWPVWLATVALVAVATMFGWGSPDV